MSLGREIKEAIGTFGAINRMDNEARRTAAYEKIAEARSRAGTGLPPQSVLDEDYRRKHGVLPPGASPPGLFSRLGNALGFGGRSSGGGGGGATYGSGSTYEPGSIQSSELAPPDVDYTQGDTSYGNTDYGDENVQGVADGGVVMGYQDGGAAVRACQQQWANANTSAVQARGTPPEVEIPAVGPGDPSEIEVPAVQNVAPGAPAVAPGAAADSDYGTGDARLLEQITADPTAPPYTGTPSGVPVIGPTRQREYGGAYGSSAPADAAPKGNSKRKALRDQTRTEAYDPVLDKDDPDSMIRMAINGAMEWANDKFHLRGDRTDAIGTMDPHTAGGRKAFLGGTGAAPEELMQQINRLAAETAPDKNLLASDPNVRDSIISLRRQVIVYERLAQAGHTDKANKASFEILQYAAVKASEFGAQAKRALDAGDVEGAKKFVARAYSQIPDGNHMVFSPDGKTAIIRGDDGKPVDKFAVTPQSLLNAALGLSDKSMFWDVLQQRASMVGKNKPKEMNELDKARIENLKARTEVVRKKLSGGGGAAAPAPAPSPVAGILQDIQRATGISATNPNPGGEGSQPASPQPVAAAEPIDGDPDPDVRSATNVRPMDGTQEVAQGDATPVNPPPGSPLPARSLTSSPVPPASAAPAAASTVTPEGKPAAPAKFDPNGKDYDYESAKTAGLKPEPDENGVPHWPSRDPKSGLLLKGTGHETWQKTLDAERKAGYQIFEGKDGRYYSVMDNTVVPKDIIHDGKRAPTPVFKPPAYDVAHPGAKLAGTKFEGVNPYSKVLQDEGFRQWVAANTKNKAGPQELARVQNMEREYNNQTKAWETGKKAFEKEHHDAFLRGQALDVAEAKRVYDKSLTEHEKETLPAAINEHVKAMAESKAPDGKVRPSIWNAPPDVAHSAELKELVTNLITSNKNMSSEMATRVLAHLTTPGTEPLERQFQPQGYDAVGNVIVNPKVTRKDPKTGKEVTEVDKADEFHIRPGAFAKINRITERYRDHLLKEQAKPKEEGGFWNIVDGASKAASNIASKVPDYLQTGTTELAGASATTLIA